jgi:hypothetical protein
MTSSVFLRRVGGTGWRRSAAIGKAGHDAVLAALNGYRIVRNNCGIYAHACAPTNS